MKWLKENIFWILVILGVLALIIVTNLPAIMNLGGGSFFKGILLFPIAITGGVLIFKAFAKLLDGIDKMWKFWVIIFVMGACIVGFVELIKGL